MDFICIFYRELSLIYLKVIKTARIRNRYNQVPHLSQDTKRDSNKITINITNKSHILFLFCHRVLEMSSCFFASSRQMSKSLSLTFPLHLSENNESISSSILLFFSSWLSAMLFYDLLISCLSLLRTCKSF